MRRDVWDGEAEGSGRECSERVDRERVKDFLVLSLELIYRRFSKVER